MISDALILAFDGLLKTTFAQPQARRPAPDNGLTESKLGSGAQQETGRLMRVNHAGEVCAQALYLGQAITTPHPALKRAFYEAAREEEDHLAWTRRRLAELGAKRSRLDPFWYCGALALGALAGSAGDRWSLGFLAETETQVEAHLSGHLERLPREDLKSRAILLQMRRDETRHAEEAAARGARRLPLPLRLLMRASGKLMTQTAYHI